MQPFEKMPFNSKIVEALEELLERVKEGRVSFFAYALCEGVHYSEDGYLGDTSCFHAGHYALHHCAKRLMTSMENLYPKTHMDAPANMYAYDMSAEPINHDFIVWMITAMMMQKQDGVEGPTKVCLIRNVDEQKFGTVFDPVYRDTFRDNVMLPAAQLFGVEVTPEAGTGRRFTVYTYRDIVKWARQGQEVPRIKVPEALMEDMRRNLDGVEPVTITLREVATKQWSHRNSSLTDWIRFAEYLEDRGEKVIFVRDYAKADEDITGFETMPAASKNFLVRAALYENAKCNMFVSNGPQVLALFGTRPWLQFIHCDEGEQYPMNTPQWWFVNHGISRGQQYPWSAPNQRIVWEADTFEAMVRAWEETFSVPVAEAAE